MLSSSFGGLGSFVRKEVSLLVLVVVVDMIEEDEGLNDRMYCSSLGGKGGGPLKLRNIAV